MEKMTETPTTQRYEAVPSLPSTDASDGDFASRLNKMALMVQDEQDATSISYRPSSSVDSVTSIQPAKPIRGDDEREYHSPSLVRENDGGVQFREESALFDESSSFSEEDQPQHLKPRSMSQVKLKLAKATKENALLRQKLSILTQTTASLQSSHDNHCSHINDLQQSVENERDLCKSVES